MVCYITSWVKVGRSTNRLTCAGGLWGGFSQIMCQKRLATSALKYCYNKSCDQKQAENCDDDFHIQSFLEGLHLNMVIKAKNTTLRSILC